MVSTDRNQMLVIRLEVPKESYSLGEPIEVTVVLKNQSGSPVTINKRMGVNPADMAQGYWELRFDMTYPPGTPFFPKPLVNRGRPNTEDFTLLPPGEEISRTYQLTDWCRMQFLGDYEVKAIYNNAADGSQFGLSAWTGEISSNSIKLQVTE